MPMLYVTHSAEEMLRLADHLVLLRQGRVTAQGPPAEVLICGHGSAAADGPIGALFDGHVTALDRDFGLCSVNIGGIDLWLPDAGSAIGSSVRVLVSADQISLSRSPSRDGAALNALSCSITGIADDRHPALALVSLSCGQQMLVARVARRALADLGLRINSPAWAQVDRATILPVYSATGAAAPP